MQETRKINLIFDLDGTLVDSYDSIIDWFYRVLSHYNIDIPKEKLRELAICFNCDYAMEIIAKDHNIDLDELKIYSKTVIQDLDLIKPFPSVENVINNPNFNCYIFTHRGKTTPYVMKNLGWENKFIEVVTSLYKFPRKPSPEGIEYLLNKYKMNIDDTYYVGDRRLDLDCGANAGIKTIFVKSSPFYIDSSNATFVVEKIEDINLLKL